jgi:hypothetical protein
VPEPGGYRGCPQATAESEVGSVPCDTSVVASGRMTVHLGSRPAADCGFALQLLVVSGSQNLELRAQPQPTNEGACPGAVAFPVATAIAGNRRAQQLRLTFSLPTALSGGVDGAAAPFVRTPSRIELVFSRAVANHQRISYLSSVSCPPSGKWTAGAANGSATASATAPCQTGSGGSSGRGLPIGGLLKGKQIGNVQRVIRGVVVHTIPAANTFVLADPLGHLATIHAAGTLPSLGNKLAVGVDSLSDGQYLQTCLTTRTGTQSTVTLNGYVSEVSKSNGVFVLSVAGASILMHRTPAGKLPALFHDVTVKASITPSGLMDTKFKHDFGSTANRPHQLVGVLEQVRGTRHRLTFATISASDDGSALAGTYKVPTLMSAKQLKQAVGLEVEFTIAQSPGVGPSEVSWTQGPSSRQFKLQNAGKKKAITLDQWQKPISPSAGLACRR